MSQEINRQICMLLIHYLFIVSLVFLILGCVKICCLNRDNKNLCRSLKDSNKTNESKLQFIYQQNLQLAKQIENLKMEVQKNKDIKKDKLLLLNLLKEDFKSPLSVIASRTDFLFSNIEDEKLDFKIKNRNSILKSIDDITTKIEYVDQLMDLRNRPQLLPTIPTRLSHLIDRLNTELKAELKKKANELYYFNPIARDYILEVNEEIFYEKVLKKLVLKAIEFAKYGEQIEIHSNASNELIELTVSHSEKHLQNEVKEKLAEIKNKNQDFNELYKNTTSYHLLNEYLKLINGQIKLEFQANQRDLSNISVQLRKII